MAHKHRAVRQHKFLHIHAEQAVGGEFIDLPDGAQGHGEAEGKQAHEEGGQADGQMLVPVEDGDDHEPEEAHHHAAAKVADAVPLGYQIVEAPYLAQENGAVQEHNVEAVEQAGQDKMKFPLQDAGQVDGDEPENALHQHQQIVGFRVVARFTGTGRAAEDHPQDQVDNGHNKAERNGDIQEFSELCCIFHGPCPSTSVFPLFLNIS